MNRKGIEKPIEIFVALFIVLAITLVLVKSFHSQLAEKDARLTEERRAQEARELRQQVELSCQDKCTQASNNGCSLASLASLCIHSSRSILQPGQYVDLNGNGENDYDQTLLAGIGVCEDRLYCFHTMGSCCAREINAASCKEILDEYWTGKGLVNEDVPLETMLTQLVPAGTCTGENRWDREWLA